MTPTLIVLAGGMGSRFGGPKQLVPVGPGGESILEYNVHNAVAAGFKRVVVVTRAELVERVKATAGRASGDADFAITLQHVPEGREKPYGTAEAVWTAAEHVDDAFCVANADDLYGPAAFQSLFAHASQNDVDGAIVGFRLSDTVPADGTVTRGLLRHDDGEVKAIMEIRGIGRDGDGWLPKSVDGIGALTGRELISTQLLSLPSRVMARIGEAVDEFVSSGDEGEVLLPEVIGSLLASGELRVRLLGGGDEWAGMTNPEDLETVRGYVRQRWPAPLFN
jgi:dTDP-glucose pyrophosphorylase